MSARFAPTWRIYCCRGRAFAQAGQLLQPEMITEIEQIFDLKIEWREEIPGGVQFYAYVDGELCQLSMNDYPDEPMYTLRWREYSVGIDDHPPNWGLPSMPK